jgi:hypothetical protein
MQRRRARVLGSAVASLALAATSAVVQAPHAEAADPRCAYDSSDFDHDYRADQIIGIPGGSGRGGAVQVRLSNDGGDPITKTITGVAGFGSAVTTLSSYTKAGDEALCSQLVVGSPDEDNNGLARAGVVYVYEYRQQEGRFQARAVYFAPQNQGVGGTAQAGARFGAALAAQQRAGENSDSARTRLYVGSPGQDVGGVRDVGQVTSFVIDDDEDPGARESQVLTYASSGVPGNLSAGGALGSSISVDQGLVAIGAPGQTAGGVARAGAVLVAPDRTGSGAFMPYELSQASSGVPGTVESGDRFGAAVHVTGDGRVGRAPQLLVGAPGEDLGATTDSGSVTVAPLSRTTGRPDGTVRSWDQNSTGMAGTAETGDALGSSVTSTESWKSGLVRLAGAPGEDVGSARDAGMVQIVGAGPGWTQDSTGVPGTSEAGDRMGASLGGTPSSGYDNLLTGVPGEDASAGAVLMHLPLDDSRVTRILGTRAGSRYGFSVGP